MICSETEFIEYWNSKIYLPKIRGFTKGRQQKLKLRLKERVFADNWRKIIDALNNSEFHTGRKTGYKWVATIDWFLRNDENPLKILESACRKEEEKQIKIQPGVQRAAEGRRRICQESQKAQKQFEEQNTASIKELIADKVILLYKTIKDPRLKGLIEKLRPEIPELLKETKEND